MRDFFEDVLFPLSIAFALVAVGLLSLSLLVWGWLAVFGVIEMP